jgi:Cu/Ag efflux pump CusA
MIGRILSLSVRMRWLVAFLTLLVVAFGGWQITKLPIDAVPDVTNRQVQISTVSCRLARAGRRGEAGHLSPSRQRIGRHSRPCR